MKSLLLMLIGLLWALPCAAQPLPIDLGIPPLPTVQEQHVATVWSNIPLAINLGFDTWASWQDDRRVRAFVHQGARIALAEGTAYAIKRIVHRQRPCAPDCGSDDPNRSFPSGHATLAFSAIGRDHLAFTVTLASSTGALRIAGKKHFLTDVVPGAALGILVSTIR